MTRDEAAHLVKAFFEAYGVDGPAFDERDACGAMLGASELFFEYQPERQSLKSLALVYRFRAEPKEQILNALKREATTKAADTGGGALEYQPENLGLYLRRTYENSVAAGEFNEEIKRLAAASLVWGNEILDRVASRVFHPEEIAG
jgi:hypothetical protein